MSERLSGGDSGIGRVARELVRQVERLPTHVEVQQCFAWVEVVRALMMAMMKKMVISLVISDRR
jgi:hypothetical protein